MAQFAINDFKAKFKRGLNSDKMHIFYPRCMDQKRNKKKTDFGNTDISMAVQVRQTLKKRQ